MWRCLSASLCLPQDFLSLQGPAFLCCFWLVAVASALTPAGGGLQRVQMAPRHRFEFLPITSGVCVWCVSEGVCTRTCVCMCVQIDKPHNWKPTEPTIRSRLRETWGGGAFIWALFCVIQKSLQHFALGAQWEPFCTFFFEAVTLFYAFMPFILCLSCLLFFVKELI